MPRIAGINIPDNKRVEVSLTYIYGIGRPLAKKILAQSRINPDTRAGKLNPEEMNKLKVLVEKHRVEGELKRDILFNIKRLKEIGCYRGVRHIKGLPVRGQRTKTNARTLRGARKTVSSGRKKGLEKT